MRLRSGLAIVLGAGFLILAATLWTFERVAGTESWADHSTPALAAAVAGVACLIAAIFLRRAEHRRARDVPADFLAGERELEVVAAIRRFERETTGELRVHLEVSGRGEPVAAASRIFEKLGMERTRDRNGILFWVAVAERRFAVVGDVGIHAVVDRGFWDDIVRKVEARFAEEAFAEGLIDGIEAAGAELVRHFPAVDGDRNELPDGISRSR